MVAAAKPVTNAPAWDDYTFDGRPGGLPDWTKTVPDIVQIGSEGGLLPKVNVIPSTPISYEQNRRSVSVMNVWTHGLYMGPAERADVLVDFSKYAGKTLILYNDAPAPNPGFDPRVDYYTGNGDNTGVGGADMTLPGYGPNSRTVMRFKVSTATPAAALNVTSLGTAVSSAFAATQIQPIVPQGYLTGVYPSLGNVSDNLARISTGTSTKPYFTINNPAAVGTRQMVTGVVLDSQGYGYTAAPTVTFTGGGLPDGSPLHATGYATLDSLGKRVLSVTISSPGSYTSVPDLNLSTPTGAKGLGAAATPVMSGSQNKLVLNKGIQELFDANYGRMNATFSVELPFTSALNQTTIPYGYIDPPTEYIADGESQIWKITHNGVDTHPIHFHLFNVQVINRVGWGGTIKPADPSEYGWKETVKMNPLEDVYIAVQPKSPKAPFGVPGSSRPLDPTQPVGATAGFTGVSPFTGVASAITNEITDFGWEYVWHCHILGHEENDFMRPIVFDFLTQAPPAVAAPTVSGAVVTWVDPTPANIATTLGNKGNEVGFIVQRYTPATGWLPKLPATPPGGMDLIRNMQSADAVALLKNMTLANVTSWTDPAPVAGATYRVVAYNDKAYSITLAAADLAAAGPADPNQPPSDAPSLSSVTASITGSTPNNFTVTVNWGASQSNAGGFKVVRSGGFAPAGGALPDITFPAAGTFAAGTRSLVDTTAPQNAQLQYKVIPSSASGKTGIAMSSVVQTPFLPAPDIGTWPFGWSDAAGVHVLWGAPGTGVWDSYFVEARPYSTVTGLWGWQEWVVKGSVNPISGAVTPPPTEFLDTSRQSGDWVYYRVGAINGTNTGNLTPWNWAVWVNASPVPAASLTAANNSAGTVTLGWANSATLQDRYYLERAPITIANGVGYVGAFAAVPPSYLPPNATSFANTGVAANSYFAYRITPMAGSVQGSSVVTQLFTGTMTPTGTPTASGLVATQVTLNWTAPALPISVTGLQVQRLVGTVWTNVGTTLASNTITSTVTGLTTKTAYQFRVLATNSVTGQSVASGILPVTTP
jgi:FtsP/CotA-like multicopper oxidase with cupredoxin domain